MTRRELLLQKKIIALIKKVGGQARLLKETVVGDPDIIGCVFGFALVWEVKDGDEYDVQRIQLKRLQEWDRAGAVTAIVKSLAEAEILLQRMKAVSHTGQSHTMMLQLMRLSSPLRPSSFTRKGV